MRTRQEALQEAEKYAPRCEALAALAVVGRGVLEQAQTEHSERARAAAAAEAALERLRMEERRAALQERQSQLQASQAALALELQQMDAQLGVVAPPAAPAVEEEALCVVCMDARKQHAMVPCMHMCVCDSCAQRLLDAQTPRCPVCRTPVESTTRVFFQ